MENIFKISKRGIIAILALCILLGIAGTCMDVTAMAAETTATIEEVTATVEGTTATVEETAVATEDTTVVTEENTQELVPVMAQRCGNACTHEDMVFDHSENDGTILVYLCNRCGHYIRQKAG